MIQRAVSSRPWRGRGITGRFGKLLQGFYRERVTSPKVTAAMSAMLLIWS